MNFLVSQMFIKSQEGDNITMFCAIRKVIASNRFEAIGKFNEDTKDLTFTRRVEPVDCFLIKDLKTIV